jgi:hypothetical protein
MSKSNGKVLAEVTVAGEADGALSIAVAGRTHRDESVSERAGA